MKADLSSGGNGAARNDAHGPSAYRGMSVRWVSRNSASLPRFSREVCVRYPPTRLIPSTRVEPQRGQAGFSPRAVCRQEGQTVNSGEKTIWLLDVSRNTRSTNRASATASGRDFPSHTEVMALPSMRGWKRPSLLTRAKGSAFAAMLSCVELV